MTSYELAVGSFWMPLRGREGNGAVQENQTVNTVPTVKKNQTVSSVPTLSKQHLPPRRGQVSRFRSHVAAQRQSDR